nr:PREDICTED: 26S proteasome non-ATPase regulatory subunit 8 isoform X1 [Anolis carolinensis]|eukprot:XP_008118122.1 PREDICTED: 26S proteasome non-ATPase regulatory subunit 8 isoform X1 [Anolis carolinensis]
MATPLAPPPVRPSPPRSLRSPSQASSPPPPGLSLSLSLYIYIYISLPHGLWRPPRQGGVGHRSVPHSRCFLSAHAREGSGAAVTRGPMSERGAVSVETGRKEGCRQARPVAVDVLALLELNFLPTTGSKLTKQQLILARDILEIGAQWSILKKDIPSFERYMAQLKCYYFDYKDELPESAYKHQLLGLNLLFLLSQNRVAEFHTELERLPAKDIQTNVYIKHPVSLEQYLMEGSYNKVFLAKGNIPAESYAFFIDILLDTVRDEIASCIEKAYEKILFNEATRMLFFTPKKMTDYAKKRGWVLGPNNHYCFTGQQQKPEDATIPSTELAKQVIEYARQLEMIV